jgi:alanine racemase
MPRPIYAEINTRNIECNFNIIRDLNKGKNIWAVVKANAYGHGIKNIWKHLAQADGFALLDIQEAVLLRNEGWKGRILLLEGFFQTEDLDVIDHYQLTFAVHSQWQVEAVLNHSFNHPADVYLKVNTGMNRLGFPPQSVSKILDAFQLSDNVRSVTVMSHFAAADTVSGTDKPMKFFEQINLPTGTERCLANSAALLWHCETHADWVRPGIVLYGASPTGKWSDIDETGLKAVMSLRSKLIAIQHLNCGDRVGYGGLYRATRSHKIGVIACGYADGYLRSAREGTPVLVNGIVAPLVGRVSMDMLTVDLSNQPSAKINDDVELWGPNLPVDDVANASGTIGYELLTALAPRVPIKLI